MLVRRSYRIVYGMVNRGGVYGRGEYIARGYTHVVRGRSRECTRLEKTLDVGANGLGETEKRVGWIACWDGGELEVNGRIDVEIDRKRK